jgi:uncharacterized protein
MNRSFSQKDGLFGKPGPKNSEKVLKRANDRARELFIKKVIVATTSGRTASDARRTIDPAIEIIAVTHSTGFAKPNYQEMTEEMRRDLQAADVAVLTTQHAFAGVGRAVRHKLSTYQIDEIIAYTLRIFGQGAKVAVEIALMAADAGLVRTDEDVISIGGTGKGADTAFVLQPANSFHFFDLKVKEIICKPFNV